VRLSVIQFPSRNPSLVTKPPWDAKVAVGFPVNECGSMIALPLVSERIQASARRDARQVDNHGAVTTTSEGGAPERPSSDRWSLLYG